MKEKLISLLDGIQQPILVKDFMKQMVEPIEKACKEDPELAAYLAAFLEGCCNFSDDFSAPTMMQKLPETIDLNSYEQQCKLEFNVVFENPKSNALFSSYTLYTKRVDGVAMFVFDGITLYFSGEMEALALLKEMGLPFENAIFV